MTNQKTRKRTGNSSQKKKVERDDGLQPYKDEITIVVTVVVCILMVLSSFDMCGHFGIYISSFLFGMFGCIGYLLPFGIFIGIAFYISNKGNRKAKRKLISTICLLVDLTALFQMADGQNGSSMKIEEYYQASSQSRLGGGITGGLISKGLMGLFGKIGAVVILLGVGVLLFMFITEKLIFAYLGRQSYQKMQIMKEQKKRRRDEMEARQEKDGRQMAPAKRSAKTFVIDRREPEPDKKTNPSENVTEQNDNRKAKKNKKLKKKIPAGMEEILPQEMGSLSIERHIPDIEKETSNSIPVYEEELMQKFSPVHAKVSESILQSEPVPREEEQKSSKAPVRMKEERQEQLKEELDPEVLEEVLNDFNTGEIGDFSGFEITRAEEKGEKQENRIGSADGGTIGILSEEEPVTVEPKDGITVSEPDLTKKNEVSKAALPESGKPVQEDKQEDVMESLKAKTKQKPEPKPYEFPSVQLLQMPVKNREGTSDQELKETAYKLHKTLESFGVRVNITNVSCGPTVTRYELHPEQGVKVSKITSLADDIKLNLAAADIRIEAPIPGKAAVGIEVPNKVNSAVMLRELIESKEFKRHSSNIAFAVGKDIAGKTVVSDIAKMPHLLIAGATGSGKSVCINTLIMSILYKASPEDVKLIMVDPKVVELSVYNGIPHLLIPVVTDPKKASAALNWAVAEMTERYKKFAELGVRDLKGYNAKIKKVEYLEEDTYQKMPEIVIIVDELADLMMVAPGEVEEAICRLAQLARAAGIHLIIATQRPSVNVITGVIKANIPSRIAFSVSSGVDSRTIIDGSGAEKLLGKGDMLFYPTGYPKPIRVQGAFISDQEVSSVVEFLTRDVTAAYDNSVVEKITTASKAEAGTNEPSNDRDEYFMEAAKFIIEKDKASIGMLQRVFKIGFNRASRIMDQLYEAGVVGEDEGTKPRKVVMSMEQFEAFTNECL